jgi:hypothetical protein
MTEVRAHLLHICVHEKPPWQELLARDVLYINALQLNFVHQYAEHSEILDKFNELGYFS